MFALPTTQTRVAIPQTLVGSGFAVPENPLADEDDGDW
jgi:hypothetical protein